MKLLPLPPSQSGHEGQSVGGQDPEERKRSLTTRDLPPEAADDTRGPLLPPCS